MMSEFEYECLQRKRLAQQAKYRKCGSKSKKCSLSTDYMTHSQWKKRNGVIVTVNLKRPISWDEFKALPKSMQEEYMLYMMENFGANATSFAEMFGVQPLTIRRHIQSQNLAVRFPVGHSMTAAQKNAWNELINGAQPAAEPAFDTMEDSQQRDSDNQENSLDVAMKMRRFSLCFSGEIDVKMISNSLISILGDGASGCIEITCDLN